MELFDLKIPQSDKNIFVSLIVSKLATAAFCAPNHQYFVLPFYQGIGQVLSFSTKGSTHLGKQLMVKSQQLNVILAAVGQKIPVDTLPVTNEPKLISVIQKDIFPQVKSTATVGVFTKQFALMVNSQQPKIGFPQRR